MNDHSIFEVWESIERIEKLLATNIFAKENSDNPFVNAALLEVLVCLRDLMAKTERLATRVDFTDDIVITDKVKDVSDCVKLIRDTLCHLDSNNTEVQRCGYRTRGITYGKTEPFFVAYGLVSSDYEDDVCFGFGVHRLYLKRHIIRALEEAKQKLHDRLPVRVFDQR
jgi:hypothetical protein